MCGRCDALFLLITNFFLVERQAICIFQVITNDHADSEKNWKNIYRADKPFI